MADLTMRSDSQPFEVSTSCDCAADASSRRAEDVASRHNTGETTCVLSVGAFLKAARLQANLSQRKLAELAGVSFPHISKIEAGHEIPSEDLLLRLADILDVSADELLLAADRLPEDVSQAILAKRRLAPEFLRSWQSGDITDDEVKELLKRARGDR
jgi:transcriptional regulator with XRE-family HTH domain